MKRIGLGLLLFAILVAATVPIVGAKPQTAVTLIYFQASEEQDEIHLTWETGSEIETVAFYIRRSDGGDFVDLTELYDENGNLYPGGIIDSEGDPAIGSDYIAIDRSTVTGVTYTYQLMEIEDNNSVNLLSTLTITTGATATPTLETINNSNPTATATSAQSGNNNTATPTMTVTSTSSPSESVVTKTPLAVSTVIRQNNQEQTTATAVNNNNALASTTNVQTGTNPREVQETENQAQATASAYPGGTATLIPTATDESYPGQPPTLLPLETATPYPLRTNSQDETPTPTIIAVIGDDHSLGEEAVEIAEAVPGQTSLSSLSVLWGGFLLALIIFIAAIIGSIMIFVRKNN